MSTGKAFVNEFVVGFGFLSGLWVHVGVDPEAVLIDALAALVPSAGPLLWVLSALGMVVSVAGAFAAGGWLGVIAVALAFLGGIFISGGFGVFCLVVAVILGAIAPYADF